jgi:hypothetical protein
MTENLLEPLMPIFIMMALGYFAGWTRDINVRLGQDRAPGLASILLPATSGGSQQVIGLTPARAAVFLAGGNQPSTSLSRASPLNIRPIASATVTGWSLPHS